MGNVAQIELLVSIQRHFTVSIASADHHRNQLNAIHGTTLN
jgi:hypothetical protein